MRLHDPTEHRQPVVALLVRDVRVAERVGRRVGLHEVGIGAARAEQPPYSRMKSRALACFDAPEALG